MSTFDDAAYQERVASGYYSRPLIGGGVLPEVIELKGYTPKVGDVLFVKVASSSLSMETADRLKRGLEATIPGVVVVVLGSDVTVEVPA